MPGLFDTLMSGGFDDTESGRNAQLALAAGLLGGRGSFGSILGSSLMGAQDTYRSSKKDALSAEMTRAQLDEIKRQAEAAKRKQATEDTIAKIQSQFYKPPTPGSGGVDATGGMETAVTPPSAGGIDLQGMMGKLYATPGGFDQALKLQGMLRKDAPTIHSLGAGGGAYIGPDGTVHRIQGEPKEDAVSPVSRLMAERDKFPVNSGPWKVLDAALKKASTHPEPIRIENMQAPQPMWNPETKKFEMVQTSGRRGATAEPVKTKSGVSYQPPPKELSASTKEKLAANNVELSKIDKALKGVEEYPDAFGAHNIVIPDFMQQRIDPKGVEIRARVAALSAVRIHDMAGATQAVQEVKRLKPYIPDMSDDAGAVTKKLTLFKEEFAAMNAELASGKSLSEAGAPKSKNANVREKADAIIGKP